MCGRFVMDYKVDLEIQDLIDEGWSIDDAMTAVLGDLTPTYSVAPTNLVPVFGDHRIDIAHWGFKRVFGGRKQNLINARMDRLATARTWKKPLLTSRCIVPMSGYYEWVDRKPWYISADDPLAAAGLFESREDGNYVTIITTEGRDEAGRVHDRMPAFLTDDLWDDWLGEELTEPDAADLLATVEESVKQVASSLSTWRVDPKINSVRIDPRDPNLIAQTVN